MNAIRGAVGQLCAVVHTNKHVQVATGQVKFLIRMGLSAKMWAMPLAIGGAWFVFPALTKGFLSEIGLPTAAPAGAAPIASGQINFKKGDFDFLTIATNEEESE